MSIPVLYRETFARSRALEFFDESELTMQIGCERDRWLLALVKELVDNGLDACEGAGIAPEITITVTRDAVTVSDNGPGMPDTTITRMLDPTVRVSSNLGYVAPTRGRLGNAWKCLVGAAYIEGGSIEIATGAEVHTLTVTLDQIQQVPVVQHLVSRGSVRTGTDVTLRWSEIASSLDDAEAGSFYKADLLSLCREYAVLNPHGTFQLRQGRQRTTLATSIPTWRKWQPRDPTSPHWYSDQDLVTLIAAYVARDRDTGQQRTVRELVAEFAGLSGSAKQKAVTDAAGLTGARLIDLVQHETQLDAERVATLLAAMQRESRSVAPIALGLLGRDHCVAQLVDLWQVAPASVRYKRVTSEVDGVPFVVEAAFGIHAMEGVERVLSVGCNFSPLLNAEDAVDALSRILHESRVDAHDPVVVLAHLVTPQPPFTEHGKRALAFGADDARAAALADAVRHVIPKTWKQSKRRADREDRLQMRDLAQLARAARSTVSLKQAAYAAMAEAYLKASANGTLPANARQIMYAARPIVLAATGGECWRDSAYFTQTILPGFLEDYPEVTATWDVLYDARGHATEPHTGSRTNLGTLEVRDYIASWQEEREDQGIVIHPAFPTCGPGNRYRHMLFVEKEGFAPLFERVRLAERFDVGIMSTKGMSVTAARQFIEVLSEAGIPTLVLHDFDKSGFSILHTLRSDTRRYRFRTKPNVVDLGLRLADIETLNLDSEPVTYPGRVDPRESLGQCGATKAECNFLVRAGGWRTWTGQRVELNAMPSDQLVRWLEGKLVEHGVTKLIPKRDVLDRAYRRAVRLVTIEKQIAKLAETEARNGVRVPPDLRARIKAMLAQSPERSWDEAVWDLARGTP